MQVRISPPKFSIAEQFIVEFHCGMNRGVTTRSRAKRDIQEGKNTPEMDDTQCANNNPMENVLGAPNYQ